MSSGSALSTYAEIRLRLAGVLQNLLRFSEERKDDVRRRYLQDLLSDLADDNFRLAIFGKYNRGKSTLMNALLGMERLPTGVLPLTSVVTTVRHDSREHVQILREGWSLPQDITIEQLPEYVTEEGNPGNEKNVVLAQIFLPAEILRYGFFLIDTPGVGSSITANTKAAEAYIPRADAAIVVMSVESPLDENELELLQQVYEQVGKVFVVLNKADLITVEERQRIADVFAERVRSLIPGDIPAFVLSARHSLTLLKEGREDEDLLRLKEALLTFISQEKTGHFLRRMAERVEGLLHDEASIDYLARSSSSDKQQLITQIHKAAELARKDGGLLLTVLKQSVKQISEKRLEPHLNDWEAAMEASVTRGDAVIDAVEYLNAHEALIPTTLLPPYRPTIEQLQELVQQLKKKVTPGMSDLRPSDAPLGSSAGTGKLTGLPAFSWSAKQQVWFRLGLNRIPALLQRLLRPAIHEHRLFLTFSIANALEQRIDLVREEYEHWIDETLERGRAAITRPTPHSDRSAARERLSHELSEAVRLIAEANGTTAPTMTGSRQQHLRSYAACALCEHLVNVQFHFIRQYQYELAADPDKRRSNADRGGFCAFHTWLYESISSPQGVCSGYSQVPFHWAELIDTLQAQSKPEDLAEIARRLMTTAGTCLACEILQSAELDRLNEITGNPERLEDTPLCLPHLCKAVSKDGASSIAPTLLSEMATSLRRLGEDMQQFALKQSGLRYGWTSAGERTAHVNALRAMVGARPLSYIKTIVEI